jgi:hypothetical protein
MWRFARRSLEYRVSSVFGSSFSLPCLIGKVVTIPSLVNGFELLQQVKLVDRVSKQPIYRPAGEASPEATSLGRLARSPPSTCESGKARTSRARHRDAVFDLAVGPVDGAGRVPAATAWKPDQRGCAGRYCGWSTRSRSVHATACLGMAWCVDNSAHESHTKPRFPMRIGAQAQCHCERS